MFRKLKADEIDVRVQSVTAKGAILLLYKDARVDQVILDETVGAMNWQRSHSRENQNCTVSIWCDKKNIWVSKEDTGTESNTEKEKGLASDSFKRACFNWGIGRELYTSPFVFVSAEKIKVEEKNGRFITYEKFHVAEIDYEENHISYLVIKNDKAVVYQYGKVAPKHQPKQEQPKPKQPKQAPQLITPEQAATLVTLIDEVKSDITKVLAHYKLTMLEDMTVAQYEEAVKMLEKKRGA